MQDIATKVEGSQLTAEEFNQIPSEIENVITSTGQSLTNTDVRQLVKAISIYTGKGDFYNTSGTTNNIILNPIDNMQTPIAYNDGLRVRFIASATNTSSVTINILGLTSCELLNAAGSSLAPGELVINKEYSATYLDGKFRLFASDTSKVNLNLGNSTAITNCIIEIPQNIKWEFANNVFTAKAGSKVYVPNGKNADGSNRFDELVLTEDLALTSATATQYLICVRADGVTLFQREANNSVSGAGVTTKAGFAYDTELNLIRYYNSSGELQDVKFSLPICIVTGNSSNTFETVDQVFNGFGYIGSTVFALPGVKGLIPNGRNADGTLNNIEWMTDKIYKRDMSWASTNFCVALAPTASYQIHYFTKYFESDVQPINAASGNMWLNTLENRQYRYVDGVWQDLSSYTDNLFFAYITTNANKQITSLKHKLPFRAVDHNDLIVKADKSQFQVVSTLPSSPQADVFYFIPE